MKARASLVGESASVDRTAFTTIELLVTLGVVSLLAAISVPAVQRSRESSRKVTCVSHLRQMAIACQSHEAMSGHFPYTSTRMRMAGDVEVRSSISPHVALLPFLDQVSLFESIETEHFSDDTPGAPPTSWKVDDDGRPMMTVLANEAALTTSVPVFLCPSDRQSAAGNNYRACLGWGAGVFAASKRTLCPHPGNASGAFVAGSRTRPAQFRDGLSHTALFSEGIIGDGQPDRFTPWADLYFYNGSFCTSDDALRICGHFAADDVPHDSYDGTTWLFGSYRQTWYNHIATPNSRVPDCTSGGNGGDGGGHGVYGARSYHPGGVNLALADGAVRFASSSVDAQLWRNVSTRAGREAVQTWW